MGLELAQAMESRPGRWQSRGLWSQWFDVAKAAGFSDGEASRFANDQDENLRDAERAVERGRKRIADLVALGAETPPEAARAS
jgi:hypothetical protein